MLNIDLLTPHILNETKDYLQNINNEILEDLSIPELKEHIRNATRILLIEQDNFGYTLEELMFYISLRFKTLTENKSKNYVKDRIGEAINETSYILIESALVFGKPQKKFVVRT
jgi:hypothetical protein